MSAIDLRLATIATEIHSPQMIVDDVRAADEIAHQRDGSVGDQRHVARNAYGSQIACGAARRGDDLSIGGPAEAFEARQLAYLDLVERVIASNQQHVHFAGSVKHDAFDGAAERQMQQLGDLFAGRLARSRHLLHRFRRRCAVSHRRNSLGELDVGRIVRGRAVGDRVFTGVGEHLKLVRRGAADLPGVGVHRPERKSEPREDAHVGVVHRLVRVAHRRLVYVEGIGILHDEFTRTHYAEARAHLVAKLGLNVIQVDRQLLVAPELLARDVGDDLF